jgi:tetratricopeptide (TPR) repeat protein
MSTQFPACPSFAELLKHYRLIALLTQEELAARAGLSAQAISTLERGTRRAPRRATIELLATALALAPHERAELELAAGYQPTPSVVARKSSAPTAAPVPRLPRLVGRARELSLLERHLAEDGPPLLLLTGEPGIGKSRLLAEMERRASENGWTTLVGGCQRQGGQEPFAPLLGAIADYLRAQSLAQQRQDLRGCAWLVRLLPELAEMPAVRSPTWNLPPEQERRLMFAAVVRFLANIAGSAGVLLVLDDLQWAGADALDLLAHLLRIEYERPLRVFGTCRSTELRPQDSLAVTLDELAHTERATQLTLAALPSGAAEELLAELLRGIGRQGQGSAHWEQVLERCEGVPLFLVSYAHELRARATNSSSADGRASATKGYTVPWNVAQGIRRRVVALSQSAQDVLGMAALVGRRAKLPLLHAVARAEAHEAREVVAALEAACQAGLLMEEGEQDYVFTHDLVREVIFGDLSAARRTYYHQQIAEALERGPQKAPVEQLAYHYASAGAEEEAIRYLEMAGDKAQQASAQAEAAGYFRDVVAQLDALGRAVEAARLREKLGAALMTATQYPAALDAFEQAVAAYTAASDWEGAGRALAQIGWVHALRGTPRDGIACLTRELGGASRFPACSLAALNIALAQLYVIAGRYGEQLVAATRASEQANMAGDQRLLAQAEQRRGTALLMLGRLTEGSAALEAALPMVEAAGDLRSLSYALNNIGWVADVRGDFTAAGGYVERALAVAERLADPSQIGLLWCNRGQIAFSEGAWAFTRNCLERSADILRQIGTSRTSAWPPLALGQLCLAEGKWDEASHFLDEAIALAQRRPDREALRHAQSILAERDLLAGKATAARDRLVPLLDHPGEEEAKVAPLLPLLAWAHVELGDEETAGRELAEASVRATPQGMRPVLADAWRVRAILAKRRCDWALAEEAIEESLRLARAMPFLYAEAKALYVYGLLHQARSEPERARQRWQAALDMLGRLGERLYAEHIERALAGLVLQQHSGRSSPTKSRSAPTERH